MYVFFTLKYLLKISAVITSALFYTQNLMYYSRRQIYFQNIHCDFITVADTYSYLIKFYL